MSSEIIEQFGERYTETECKYLKKGQGDRFTASFEVGQESPIDAKLYCYLELRFPRFVAQFTESKTESGSQWGVWGNLSRLAIWPAGGAENVYWMDRQGSL